MILKSPDIALVRACEERIVNCWPAVTTMLVDGFVVRMANGYSGRSNSVSPIEIGADLSDQTLSYIEALYREAGLPSMVRVTALAVPGFEARLCARGYRLRDECIGQIAPLHADAQRVDPEIRIEASPSEAWLAGVSDLQAPGKQDPAHLQAIVGRIRVTAGFASVLYEGEAIGFGMCAIDRGMGEIGSIIINPAHQGRGVGRKLVASLMAYARGNGADRAFLQVESGNRRAISVYRSLGFEDVYLYRTLIRNS